MHPIFLSIQYMYTFVGGDSGYLLGEMSKKLDQYGRKLDRLEEKMNMMKKKTQLIDNSRFNLYN